jgi:oligopeptide transport system permease protein
MLAAIPTMLVIITVVFFMLRAAPGNPYSAERMLTPAVEANLKASLGLDKPLHEQYFEYVGKVVQGDLGPSMVFYDKDVSELLGEGLPVSLTIGLLSITIALFFGVLLGVLAAIRQNSLADYSVMSIAMVGISIPTFVTGPLLAMVFGVYLNWFAAGGLDLGRMNFHNLFLPVLTLSLPQVAIISRLMRASMVEVLRSNFIRTARAKGISDTRILLRHAAPAAVLPVVSYLGPAIVGVITGSVVIETVFTLPGLGRLLVDAIFARDYPVVQGVLLFTALIYVLVNLVVDLLYPLFDPRVRAP